MLPYITITFATQDPFTNRGQPKNEKMGSCLSISLAVPDLEFPGFTKRNEIVYSTFHSNQKDADVIERGSYKSDVVHDCQLV